MLDIIWIFKDGFIVTNYGTVKPSALVANCEVSHQDQVMPRTPVDERWFNNSVEGQLAKCWMVEIVWIRDNAMSVSWCFCPGRLVRAGCSRRFTCSHRVGCCGWSAGVWCRGRSRQFSDIHGIVSYQDVLPDLYLNHLSTWKTARCALFESEPGS